ncbi:hypothetical protein [Halobaculum sp. P14]|uniref:hypothetical protein n=1 Tax=Halobaculum sp. P14 TaxID=3421638 RepID=UPI003EBA3C45
MTAAGDADGPAAGTADAAGGDADPPDWREEYADFDGDWRRVESPTEETLYGVVVTAEGPMVSGGDGQVLFRHRGEWVVVLDAGVNAKRDTLFGMDVTDDGRRVWFAGSSGALGAYDLVEGRTIDYSAPGEKTSTWEDVAVAGVRGDERVVAANGSGELLEAEIGDDDAPEWRDVVKAGGGSSIYAVTYGPGGADVSGASDDSGGRGGDAAVAYAIDTNGKAYARRDDWVEIGVDGAQTDFADVVGTDGRLFVVGGDGLAHRYDRGRDNWTPVRVGEADLNAVDAAGDDLTVAADDGRIYERAPVVGWRPQATMTEQNLLDVAVSDGLDVAVGASGVILERDAAGDAADGT